ncbi:hypothetical protein F7230_04935 [Corynebacterium sp. 320]|uniref:Uncharacterized protein n=1 Tax=Corynebacterium zhongnanshanii TaxID=2768834 RepID=A0ABQ6VET8_9CORY|nr:MULTISPECIES: hypothetical protein [Corynebacterium]KAB1504414.1 hypothetical protein F7230_04935 [Corynebacterium sp. 320]KAB1552487.1 hypothetical protein F7233_01665 [Corynebacterium sp. 321]KAB1554298.1 hypothetical protein F7232_04935 [Corynebacterium sp. 319]KAB3522729.1 hypothetical protein F8377_00660 [Corynebacterium zhongnanshanii]KAB3528550.1 hypothetical protein F8354_04935 [Corynebacterium sp. 250]
MFSGNFRFDDFLWVSFIFVIVPSLIGVFLVRRASARRISPWRESVKLYVYAATVGFFSAAAWLSWNSHSGIADFVRRGAPAHYPPWQIVCCGATVILGSLAVSLLYARFFSDVLIVSGLTGAGFSAAFVIDASFGVPAQEGIGVVFSYIGISCLCGLVNIAGFIGSTLYRRSK